VKARTNEGKQKARRRLIGYTDGGMAMMVLGIVVEGIIEAVLLLSLVDCWVGASVLVR
jgi:hypothetical protein